MYKSLTDKFDTFYKIRDRRCSVQDSTVTSNIKWIQPLVAEIALRRGIEASKLPQFFTPRIENELPDFNNLSDQRVSDAFLNATSRLIKAIHSDEKIIMVGDYDVDGATSVAELYLFLEECGVARARMRFIIPQRMTDGYGLSKAVVDRSLVDYDAGLLIVLDSGTQAHDAISHAVSMGLDVIVIDHHKPGDGWITPQGILINPNIAVDGCGIGHLCTAGLVYLLIHQIVNSGIDIDLSKYTGLVALGTVADLMELRGLNRAYVHEGLQHIDDITGLKALADIAVRVDERYNIVDTHALGYKMGPAINAAGRIDDCMLGSELLVCKNGNEAVVRAKHLVELNSQRQKLQKTIEEQAYLMAVNLTEQDQSASVLILRDNTWHPGVIGIIASRIMREFSRPVIIIGDNGKGSGRSMHKYDLGEMLIQAHRQNLLKSGGGHAAAGGLTVNDDRYQEFIEFVKMNSMHIVRQPFHVDAECNLSDITVSMVRDLGMLAPFGNGNQAPSLLIRNCILTGWKTFGNGKYIKLLLQSDNTRIEAKIWEGVDSSQGKWLTERNQIGSSIDLVASLTLNTKYPSNPIDMRVDNIVMACYDDCVELEQEAV